MAIIARRPHADPAARSTCLRAGPERIKPRSRDRPPPWHAHARGKGGAGGTVHQIHCRIAEAPPKRAPTIQERRWLRIACYVYYGIGMQASQCLNTSCACDSAFFNRACEVQPGRARAGRWHPCIQPDARDATTGSTRASNRMRAMLPTLHRQTAVSVGSARPPPTRRESPHTCPALLCHGSVSRRVRARSRTPAGTGTLAWPARSAAAVRAFTPEEHRA